jgi:phosphohistidine swiveling domain-containing protein
MNILRKAMAREVTELKPVLDRVYHAILRYQRDRTAENERAVVEAMGPAIERLMQFRPLLPAYKARDFDALEGWWRDLSPHDLIMLFDHCVGIMHVRLERKRSQWEREQPWTAEMLRVLDSYRNAPEPQPVSGEYACSGIAGSAGRASGTARVARQTADFAAIESGEILVCRFTSPEIVPYLGRIRALVTDQGGAVSHAAILAREARVPAVTGCGDATSVLHTGDQIVVDGDLGIVMRL